jgi:hypothetical protein
MFRNKATRAWKFTKVLDSRKKDPGMYFSAIFEFIEGLLTSLDNLQHRYKCG